MQNGRPLPFYQNIKKNLKSYVNKDRILLCLSDANQPTARSKFNKFTGIQTFRLLMEMRIRHNAESSHNNRKIYYRR